MSNQEILEKVIQKAIDGGWSTTHFNTLKGDSYKHPDESEFHDLTGSWHSISPADIIFNHDFAKALWGDKPHYDKTYKLKYSIVSMNGKKSTIQQAKEAKRIPEWQYHLQQMVISDDPIKYLGESI